MQSIRLNSRVGSDGMLHLDVPVNIKNAELEVVITVKEIIYIAKKPSKSNWLPGFFAKTAGTWEGKALEREPQEEYNNRVEYKD